ncbi:hypothetical protein H1230_25080 [Paenibacillus sp. 19GGS1-52]|uniref:hypothetical protein n=1 Tax=Paenibacillus sp. 19GGS1-52 TaxID=2758563 RepID=UPI001EFAC34D|nr:hypothetical protein [Paenibacillus sp. 19GGS1-52]ULO06263.1 hypothetical protein H1230_25080 [Paenibacillus sp. 19GGS1-52]
MLKILLTLQSQHARYSELIFSDHIDIQERILLTQKYNALRTIEFFMFEDFLQTLPDHSRQCVKYDCSIGSPILTAAFLNLDVEEVRAILSEIELKMETFLGAETINNIDLARNESGVSKALVHYKSNVLKHQITRMLSKPY